MYGLRKTLTLPNIEVHEVYFPKSYISALCCLLRCCHRCNARRWLRSTAAAVASRRLPCLHLRPYAVPSIDITTPVSGRRALISALLLCQSRLTGMRRRSTAEEGGINLPCFLTWEGRVLAENVQVYYNSSAGLPNAGWATKDAM